MRFDDPRIAELSELREKLPMVNKKLYANVAKCKSLRLDNEIMMVMLKGYNGSASTEIKRIALKYKITVYKSQNRWYAIKREVDNVRESKL